MCVFCFGCVSWMMGWLGVLCDELRCVGSSRKSRQNAVFLVKGCVCLECVFFMCECFFEYEC